MAGKVGAFALAASSLVMASGVHAAADTDLTNALASTTAIFTDNKALIFGFVVGIFAIFFVFKIIMRALGWGTGKVLGGFGGRKRRR